MAESSGEKKHFATERRREQAREEGQVTKSADLASAALLVLALLALKWFGGSLCEAMAQLMVDQFSAPNSLALTPQDATHQMMRTASRYLLAILPVIATMFLAGIAVNVFQTGLILNSNAIMPKLSHINPLSGVKRITSLRGVMRLAFGLIKVSIIAVVAYIAVKGRLEPLLSMWSQSVPAIARNLFDSLFAISMWIGASLLVIGLAEYGFQWWQYEEDLKMTDQEMREEIKESNGNPQVIQRRKQIQRQMMNQRINSEVPKADFIATNPTELAIAVSYNPETMIAPIVVAKGAGVLAQRIRKIALEHGIPIVERKELAQFLYKNVDIGGAIGVDQYQAVAEVLRYVYQLKGKALPKAPQRAA